MISVLFPSDYLNPDQPDPAFVIEWTACKENGLETLCFDSALFDEQQKIQILPECASENKRAIYRGWMMKPERYFLFEQELKKQNLTLITDSQSYARMHLFVRSYPFFKDDTPAMISYKENEQPRIEEIRQIMDSFLIKDYVKSVKGTGFEMKIPSSISQEELDERISRFKTLRGNLFTGGICIKEWVSLKTITGRTNEWRVFYGRNQILSKSPNSCQPSRAECLPAGLAEKYASLDSPFYTVDFAQLQNGQWIVIEAGDGGVSGLSPNQNAQAFYRTLKTVFE